ncbi:MAG TPA: hypothetical protein VF647_19340 [Longimicrobium sp.]
MSALRWTNPEQTRLPMKQLLTVLALAALAACGDKDADNNNTGATTDPAASSAPATTDPAATAPVTDPAATPAMPADSAAAAGTTAAPAAGTDSAAPASH